MKSIDNVSFGEMSMCYALGSDYHISELSFTSGKYYRLLSYGSLARRRGESRRGGGEGKGVRFFFSADLATLKQTPLV